MSSTFFQDLPPFTAFEQACDPKMYHTAPEDWFVVLTDIQGSTKAIEAGQYKDVNMVGAACITAVVNACKGVNIPYVFGGDGATLLIPPQMVEKTRTELLALKQISFTMHKLQLRVDIVPMIEITKRGKKIAVAKYQMPTGCSLAMFRGGGVNLADDLVKNGGFAITEDGDKNLKPDLKGLSCRWQPIKAQRDTILTLLVMSTNPDKEDARYQDINSNITRILETDASPVKLSNLRYSWPGWKQLRQSQMVWRSGNWLKGLFGHISMAILFHILHLFNLKLGRFNVAEYRDDMITNSDYRKFDDMLRMVVDCSQEQVNEIEGYLSYKNQATLSMARIFQTPPL